MSYVTCMLMCRDVLLPCEHLVIIAFVFRFVFCVHVHVLGFAFTIRDMIGRGMMCGDVTTNSSVFLHESCWYVTKSAAFLD